jgi:hypothetical protein
VITTTVVANISVTNRAISSPSRNFIKKEREPVAGPAPFKAVVVVATSLRRPY